MTQNTKTQRASYRVNDGICYLTMTRAEKRNALDEEMLNQLAERLDDAEKDDSVQAIVMSGEGSVFSAGADRSIITGITDPTEVKRLFAPYAAHIASLIEAVGHALVSMRKPTVAAINGDAVGGGLVLALAADFRIAAQDSRFWFPEIELGRAIGRPTVELLLHHVGPAVAREMTMTGKRYASADLLRLNLINQAVDRAEVLARSTELAQRLKQLYQLSDENYLTVKKRTNRPLLTIWGAP